MLYKCCFFRLTDRVFNTKTTHVCDVTCKLQWLFLIFTFDNNLS